MWDTPTFSKHVFNFDSFNRSGNVTACFYRSSSKFEIVAIKISEAMKYFEFWMLLKCSQTCFPLHDLLTKCTILQIWLIINWRTWNVFTLKSIVKFWRDHPCLTWRPFSRSFETWQVSRLKRITENVLRLNIESFFV